MEGDDDVADLLRLIDQVNAVDVLLNDIVRGEHFLAHPVDQSAPVVGAEKDHWEIGDLLGLNQCQRVEQLVQRAEAAGKRDERLGVLHKHHLADEEIAEGHSPVDEFVDLLLERKLDVAADGERSGLARPAIGCLHDPRAPAGDDGKACFSDQLRRAHGRVVVLV